MSWDIGGVLLCLFLLILPTVIVILAAAKRLIQDIRWRRMMKTSEMLEKNCKSCIHVYTGIDYLSHCDLMDSTGICNPKTLKCFRRP